MRIYFATPLTGQIDRRTGAVTPTYENSIRRVLEAMRSAGHTVFLALERERWGREIMLPDRFCPLDFAEITRSDVVVAITGNPPSGGVHVELGWASALGKPIIVVLSPEVEHTPLLWGLHAVSQVVTILCKGELEQATDEIIAGLSRFAIAGAQDDGFQSSTPRKEACFRHDLQHSL